MQTLQARQRHQPVTHHQVTGGNGVPLHVVETGIRGGKPIVFLHGFSQSWLSWRPQLYSELAEDYQLMALDLRGHGQSDKPQEGYSDCIQWADDVNAVSGAEGGTMWTVPA
jgi:pimeloyl-ACP methyl ester carboxylesterase